jgi:serine/alanine adding enzyme
MSRTLTHLESNGNSRNFVNDRLTLRALEIDFRSDARWQSFVEAHPNGTIYHSSLWLDVLEKEYGHRTVALVCENGDGDLRALLPLVYTKGLPLHMGGQSGARRLSSLPRTPFGGPLSLDRLASAVVLRAAIERVKHDPRLRLQVKTHEVGLDKLADGLICKPWRLTYVLELPNRPEDPLFGNSRNRNRIRWAVNKATREGVRVRVAETREELRAWYELYLDTMRRNAVPPRPRRFFENLWNSMYPAGFMQLLLAEQVGQTSNRLLAGSIFLMFGHTISYAFNGSRRKDLSLRPNDAILSFAIHKARDTRFQELDFGEVPAGHTRLAEFKSKWGSKPRQLVRYYYPASSESISEQPDGYAHRLAETLWQKLPLKTTAVLGDWLYEYL